MKCYRCQAAIPDGSVYCPRCGVHQGFGEELIRRARQNDQEAITELYNKTYSNVYYTIKSMVKDEDTVLDIMQDSYVKAFRSLDQLLDPTRFRAWIKRIAHNRTVDYLRKTKTISFSSLESEESDLSIEFEDTRPDHLPEVTIDRAETTRLMSEILDSLPADQRAVVSMFYYERMSVREIAEELGISENTVKSRLNYGRKKIEAQVLELERRGTKLYSLAPIPFLVLLLRSQEAYAAEIPAASLLHGITAGLTAETAAAGTIGSTAGKAAARLALRTKIIAGIAAAVVVGGGGAIVYEQAVKKPPVIEQEAEQILPRDFLYDMEALAEDKLSTVLEDNASLTIKTVNGEVDVPVDYISIQNAKLTKDAVFTETGGVTVLYLVFEGDFHVSENWDGLWVLDSADYPDASIVFALNSFPLKFLREDGTIVYTNEDFQYFKTFLSRADFEQAVTEDLRYVDHERHNIQLP